MNNFIGIIIEESLEKKDVLQKVKIIKTKVEEVNPKHNTPYLRQWTKHVVEISKEQADKIAEELSKALESSHGDWYADFKDDKIHYIIFRNRIFKIDRTSKEQYDEAKKYGISLGIPDYQLAFKPITKQE